MCAPGATKTKIPVMVMAASQAQIKEAPLSELCVPAHLRSDFEFSPLAAGRTGPPKAGF